MSCYTKKELENMLEDAVNELELSQEIIKKHGQEGTAPAKLVRLVLEQKDREIKTKRIDRLVFFSFLASLIICFAILIFQVSERNALRSEQFPLLERFQHRL